MRSLHILLVALITLPAAQWVEAQHQPEWIPQGVEALQQSASSKTEFTLDHSMLVFASKLDQDNDDLRRVVAGVSGLSIHSYRFSEPWRFDPAALSSVKQEYQAAGWKQLVNHHQRGDGAGVTDLWIRLENNAISNVAILLSRSNEVSLILVSGSISPLDLSHLGGHFGIPKIEGGVLVPNRDRRP